MNELRVTDKDTPFASTTVNTPLVLQAYGRHVAGIVRVRCSAFTSNTSGQISISVSDHSIGIQVAGTFVATLQFESSIDGVNFAALPMTPIAGGATVTSTAAVGQWFNTY